jgi:hypothetical protein
VFSEHLPVMIEAESWTGPHSREKNSNGRYEEGEAASRKSRFAWRSF